jgi:hypothetical protein
MSRPVTATELLDTLPTPIQRTLLQELQGDRLVLKGKGYLLECAQRSVFKSSVMAIVRRHWVTPPGLPLFDGASAGMITDCGRRAVEPNNIYGT